MTRVEQENAQHPIQELPKGEVIFSRQLTFRELLHIKSAEEDWAKGLIDDVPFNFEVRDLGNSFLHIVSFSETEPVSFEKLFLLLQSAKPGGVNRQDNQNVNGILTDWRIILPEVRKEEPRSKKLYDFHKKYVPEFSEFEADHFGQFWKALEAGNKRGEEVPFFHDQFNQFIDEREFFAKYGRGRNFSGDLYVEKIAIIYSIYFQKFLETKGFKMPSALNIMTTPKEKLESFFASMKVQEQKDLAKEFYEQEVSEGGIEAERWFGTFFRWIDMGLFKTTLIGEGDELYRIEHKGVLKPLDVYIREGDPHSKEPDSFRRLDNGQIELRKGESFIRMSIVEGEDGYKKVKLEDHRLSTAETMIPLIVWQTDKQTGRRSYYSGELDQSPKRDTLLGQLVVAAYSPKVRDQMPREITMKGVDGKDRTQLMLEAQTVLLVPRFASKFLTQSPVILGLEALAEN